MINYILLGISFLVFILGLVAIRYLIKIKRFEEINNHGAFNILIFGIICLAIIFLIDFIKNLDSVFHAYALKYIPLITSYLNYSDFLVGLMLIPLIGICFIAFVISLWK